MKLEKSLVNSFNLTYILETIIYLPLYDVLWNHLNHIILGGKSHNYTQPHICWCKKISVWKNNAYSFISCYRLTNRFRLETLHSRIVVEDMTKNKTKINNQKPERVLEKSEESSWWLAHLIVSFSTPLRSLNWLSGLSPLGCRGRHGMAPLRFRQIS